MKLIRFVFGSRLGQEVGSPGVLGDHKGLLIGMEEILSARQPSWGDILAGQARCDDNDDDSSGEHDDKVALPPPVLDDDMFQQEGPGNDDKKVILPPPVLDSGADDKLQLEPDFVSRWFRDKGPPHGCAMTVKDEQPVLLAHWQQTGPNADQHHQTHECQ